MMVHSCCVASRVGGARASRGAPLTLPSRAAAPWRRRARFRLQVADTDVGGHFRSVDVVEVRFRHGMTEPISEAVAIVREELAFLLLGPNGAPASAVKGVAALP